MVACSQDDLICLHLNAHSGNQEQSPAPPSLTAAGIGDALELGDTAASRVKLLDELSVLEEDGLVATMERPISGYDSPRTVYYLTETGQETASRLREQFRSETVEVTNGTSEEISLGEIDRYFDDTAAPLVQALARLTDDGRVPLEQYSGETFVDREAALETITEAIESSFNREGQTVIVNGAAGMGKTALVQEAISAVADERPELLTARGDSHPGPSTPYGPLRQAIEQLPNGEALLDRLEEAQAAPTPDDPDQLEAQRTALFNDIADGIREAATAQPIVVFLDSLQWADEATLDLFAHLATTIDEMLFPVAFVGTYRGPEVAGGDEPYLTDVLEQIEAAGAYTAIDLEPLARSDTRALLAGVLGRQRYPEPFLDFIYEQTGGNPLFVRETAAHLIETDRVDPEQERYPTSHDEVVLPEEVTEQIDRRLAALDEASRELLRIGAVIGERIPAGVLAAASELEPARRREYIDMLIASRLWEAVGGEAGGSPEATAGREVTADGSGAYRFVSGGVREAVVERLPPALVQEYHGRVAEGILEVYGDDLAEWAARVAYHFEQADAIEQAIAYYQQAGEHAKGTFANEDAIENYERALELSAETPTIDDATIADLQRALGEVYHSIGEFDDAITTVEAGLERASDRSRVHCELLGILAAAQTDQGDYATAREAASTQREIAAELDARDLRATAIRRLGIIAFLQGDYEQAREDYEASLEIARALDDQAMEARLLNNLGNVGFRQGAFEDAREFYEESLALARTIDDPYSEALNLNTLGAVAFKQGNQEQARTYYDETLDISREIGDQQAEARSLNNLGLVSQRQGEYQQAADYYEKTLAIRQEIGDRQGEAINRNNLGLVALRQGDYATARDRFEQTRDIARDLGDRQAEARSLNNLGLVSLRAGEFEAARDYLEASRGLSQELGTRETEADTVAYLGRLALNDGKYGDAAEYLEEALELYEAVDDQFGLAESQLAAGRVALQRGELASAEELAAAAREAFETMGAIHWVARSQRVLGRVAADQGDRETARAEWEAALETFEHVNAPHDTLATLHHLIETFGETAPEAAAAWADHAETALAASPDEIAETHREWVATANADYRSD